MGVHSIENATKDLTRGLSVCNNHFVSNTSLRRTAMNRLLAAGVPPSVIQKKTGRVSARADGDYVVAESYERQMSDVLYCGPSSSSAPQQETEHERIGENTVSTIVEVPKVTISSPEDRNVEMCNSFHFQYRNKDKEIIFSLPM